MISNFLLALVLAFAFCYAILMVASLVYLWCKILKGDIDRPPTLP